jgi:peptide/nickel transport system ATP-binding protein
MASLNPSMKIAQQLMEVPLFHEEGCTEKDAHDRALEMLGNVRLPDPARIMDAFPHQISGGQQQRVVIAMALLSSPALLLLDEPTTALDLPHQVRFFRLLHRLARDGMGIAVVTHDVNLASLYADRLLLLSAGRILSLGQPQQVLTEERVSEVYGADVLMGRHPETQRPLVIARAVQEEVD